jgi:hypothetical protein
LIQVSNWEIIVDTKMLEERLSEWRIPFAVVADLETGDATRVGCSTGLGFDDLEGTLFRDADTVLATGRSLEGQILPRMWSQGDVTCYVYKVNEKTVVALFSSEHRNPVEKYHWSKQLHTHVVNAFAPV